MAYASSFTVGPSQDYDTLSIAQADLRGVNGIQNGESVLLTLVPASFDYDGRFTWTDLRNWNANSFELTVSGDTSGIDWFSYCVEPNGNHRLANDTVGDKTFNFIGMSFIASSFDTNRTLFRIDNTANEGDVTLNFIRCKIDFSDPAAGRVNLIEDRRATALSSTYSYNASSCVMRTDDRVFFRPVGTPASGHTSFIFQGCTLHTTGSRFINPFNISTHNFTTNMSGCLGFGSNEFVTTTSRDTSFSGTVVDCIFEEPSTNTEVWAPNTRTNITNSVTFDFATTATSPGSVYFSGTDSTFTDYRLYDDSDNLAIGYVTNSISPSPDLIGNSRGTSPFDAGAFAIISDALNNAEVAFGKLFMRVH